MDWTKLRNEYQRSDISLRALAKKYGVGYSTLQARCSRENWQRGGTWDPELQRRLDGIAERLLDRLEQAIEELTLIPVITKTKVKTEDGEVNTEERHYTPGGIVDRKDLKSLAGVLKDIRDIRCIRAPLDVREQEAKIRNLERQFAEHGNTQVTVTLEGETAEMAM